MTHFLETISEQDFDNNVSRPETKWWLVTTTNITFYVNKLKNASLVQRKTQLLLKEG